MITPQHYLTLSLILFCIGLLGVLTRKNLLMVLMSIELMLNAVNLIIVSFSSYYGQLDGQVFVFFVMMVAAAEVAIGLALIVLLYRSTQRIDANIFHELKE